MDLLLSAAPDPGRGRSRQPACRHCGSPLPEPATAGDFCCPGCAYVHRLLSEGGFGAFYRIKEPVIAPVGRTVFEPRDYAWLAELQREAEAAGEAPSLQLDLQGVSCAACVWLIERMCEREPGLREARVDSSAGTLRLRWTKGGFDAPQWARRMQSFGYLLGPAGEGPERPESPELARRIGLAAAFALNVMLFTLPRYFGMSPDFAYAGLFRLLALIFATLSVLVGGGYFMRRALAALRAGAAHIDLPIALGIAGAYAGSLCGWLLRRDRLVYFDFVATFTVLMLVGRWAQIRAVEANRRRLLRHQPAPPRVRLREGGSEPRERIAAGQEIAVSPGQTVPVDCRLEQDAALFSLSSISGEAEPRLIPRGGRVPAGALQIGRSEAWLRTMEPWGQSLLARLLADPARAPERSRSLERVVTGYVAGILVLSLGTGLGWALAGGEVVRAASAAIAVLVVCCPCAVGLALPFLDETASSAARACGVYVREGGLWARLGRVRRIVFDKTGTLTLEAPTLRNPEALRALDPEQRAALAALVQGSLHPVSQCLWENLLAEGPVLPAAGEVAEIPGAGVRMGVWTLGRAGWADSGAGGPASVFAREGRVLARFNFADLPRPGAAAELARLSREGYDVRILSGDHADAVAALAAGFGVPAGRARGGMSPEGKARWLDLEGGGETLFLGDGANDSLAFDRALCRGTPLVHRGLLEAKADFYYVRRGIEGIGGLLRINRVRRQTQGWVIAFSISYNLIAAGFAAAGRITPLIAAVLMPLSSLASLALVGIGRRRMSRSA